MKVAPDGESPPCPGAVTGVITLTLQNPLITLPCDRGYLLFLPCSKVNLSYMLIACMIRRCQFFPRSKPPKCAAFSVPDVPLKLVFLMPSFPTLKPIVSSSTDVTPL